MRLPPGVGPAWLVVLAGLPTLICLGLLLTRDRPKPKIDPVSLQPVPGAGKWAPPPVRPSPTPTATPFIQRTINQVRDFHEGRVGAAAHQCDQDCQSRRRLLASIDQAPLGEVTPTANTLELASTAEHKPHMLPPCTAHCILAGTWLYTVLDTGINSDRPGDVLAHAAQNIHSTLDPTELLVPFGSKLHGRVQQTRDINPNNESVSVEWDWLELPNGEEYSLPHLPAADVSGYPGLVGTVDRHLKRTWGPAVLVSAISAGIMLAQNPTYGSSGGYNSTQEASGAFASAMGNHAVQGLGSMLNQSRPTIDVPSGTTFRIMITRDLPFEHPYGGE